MKNRRDFLQKCCSALLASSGGLLLTNCGSTKKLSSKATPEKVAKQNPCEDLTGVNAVDIEKRKSLGYVSLSAVPDKQCDSCKLWVPAAEGKECGGCLLFTGPVAAEGNCTYWAPQV